MLKGMVGVKDPPLIEIRKLEQFIISKPELWILVDYAEITRNQILQKIAKGPEQGLYAAHVEIIRKQLTGSDNSPLENLVIAQVLMGWLRLLMAERIYTDRVSGATLGKDTIMFWDQFLANAQRRYLTTIETLARIRRLGRINPAVQFNIAQSGSQQMNVNSAGK